MFAVPTALLVGLDMKGTDLMELQQVMQECGHPFLSQMVLPRAIIRICRE